MVERLFIYKCVQFVFSCNVSMGALQAYLIPVLTFSVFLVGFGGGSYFF